MPSLKSPALPNLISKDVPDINSLLNSLAKMDYAGVTDIPVNAVRFNRSTKLFEIYNGTSWASAGKLAHDVETVDGYSANAGQVANTIPVRDANKKLPGDITGNAATAGSAATLSATLPVSKGGTGATTSAAARTNLGVSYGTAAGTVVQGNDSRVVNALNKTGDTMTGNLTLAADKAIIFANTVGAEKIQLWSTKYSIGVQASTTYIRTESNFCVFKKGIHSTGLMDPGEGGTTLLQVDTSGNMTIPGKMNARGAVLSGNLQFNIPGWTHATITPLIFRCKSNSTDTTVLLQGNGLMLVGSGEGPLNYYSKYGPEGTREIADTTEDLILPADRDMVLASNFHYFDKDEEKRIRFTRTGIFQPNTNKTLQLGASTHAWNASYIANYYGETESGRWVKMYPREKLRAPTTFYIRANGNDSNDGRSEANAIKSFNSLMTVLSRDYDLNRQTVIINIGSGTWTNQSWTLYTDTFVNRGTIEIHGSGETGTNATILSASDGTTTGRAGMSVSGPSSPYAVRIKNIQFTNCTDCISVNRGIHLYATNLTFGPHFTAGSGTDIRVTMGSRLYGWGTAGALATLTHAGAKKPPAYCYHIYDSGTAAIFSYVKVNIKPDMTMATGAFAYVTESAKLFIYDTSKTEFTGILTGKRLIVNNSGKVYTSGRGEKAFPGTIESTVDSGKGAMIDRLPFITEDRIIGGGTICLEKAKPILENTFGIIKNAQIWNDGQATVYFTNALDPGSFIVFAQSDLWEINNDGYKWMCDVGVYREKGAFYLSAVKSDERHRSGAYRVTFTVVKVK